MEILNWYIEVDLKKELDNHYQARQSFEMKDKSPREIIDMYTFSFGAPALNIEDAYKFLKFAERIIGKKLSGIALEVGAGPGTHTALLARFPAIEKVYGVEASGPIVRNLMPKVVPYIAPQDKEKVIGVVGDFSHMELADQSIDFVFDFFSLHHSPDLGRTLSEIHRVLRPGGFLFCFDKARDNNLTDADLEKLLDKEYNKETKKIMGIIEGAVHTRRMNGENEYRLKDWKNLLSSVGFKNTRHYNIARTKSINMFLAFLKSLFSLLPYVFQATLTQVLSLKPTNDISPDHRIYSSLINNYQKEISLLIGYK